MESDGWRSRAEGRRERKKREERKDMKAMTNIKMALNWNEEVFPTPDNHMKRPFAANEDISSRV